MINNLLFSFLSLQIDFQCFISLSNDSTSYQGSNEKGCKLGKTIRILLQVLSKGKKNIVNSQLFSINSLTPLAILKLESKLEIIKKLGFVM